MEQFCEKCHQSGEVCLRQSEELLCEDCWKCYPPLGLVSNEANVEQQEEEEIDHSFRFTSWPAFSTPSLLKEAEHCEATAPESLMKTSFTTGPSSDMSDQTIQIDVRPRPFSTAETPLSKRSPPSLFEIPKTTESEEEIQESCENPTQLQETQEGLIFADTLLKLLTKKKEKGKEHFKWNGDIEELQAFVTFILKLTGSWKQTIIGSKPKPDQLPTVKHTFQDKKIGVTLNWWTSSKTLQFQAGQNKIESQLQNIICEKDEESVIKSDEGSVTDTGILNKSQGCQNTTQKPLAQSQDINKVWNAIEELKEQVTLLSSNITSKFKVTSATASSITVTDAEDSSRNIGQTQIEVNTKANTESKACDKVLKQKTVTEYFKPVSLEDYNNVNEVHALQIKLSRLELEKRALVQEVECLKKQIDTINTQNKNNDSKPQNPKKKAKKGKNQSQTTLKQPVSIIEPQQLQQQQIPAKEKKQQQHSTTESDKKGSEPVHKQQSTKAEEHMKTKPEKPKKSVKQVMVVGDSIIKNLKGWMMSRKHDVKIHSFSGADTNEMEYFLKPLLERGPSHVVLHVGTNDLAQGSSCNGVANRIMSLARNIVNKGISCTVSMLITRADGLNPMVKQVNNILEKLVKSEGNIDIINNDNIRGEYHLNSSRLHLNRKGDAALARNYIEYIKNASNF